MLKHTPLGDKPNGAEAHSSGEINLPSSQVALMLRATVASNAITPRCRRNRRFHTASAQREILHSVQDDTLNSKH